MSNLINLKKRKWAFIQLEYAVDSFWELSVPLCPEFIPVETGYCWVDGHGNRVAGTHEKKQRNF